jgi:hypothetical protein
VDDFAQQYMNLINDDTFNERDDSKCEEIQPFMGPRRMETEDEEEDPFVYLTKVANYNGFQYYPPPPPHSN